MVLGHGNFNFRWTSLVSECFWQVDGRFRDSNFIWAFLSGRMPSPRSGKSRAFIAPNLQPCDGFKGRRLAVDWRTWDFYPPWSEDVWFPRKWKSMTTGNRWNWWKTDDQFWRWFESTGTWNSCGNYKLGPSLDGPCGLAPERMGGIWYPFFLGHFEHIAAASTLLWLVEDRKHKIEWLKSKGRVLLSVEPHGNLWDEVFWPPKWWSTSTTQSRRSAEVASILIHSSFCFRGTERGQNSQVFFLARPNGFQIGSATTCFVVFESFLKFSLRSWLKKWQQMDSTFLVYDAKT